MATTTGAGLHLNIIAFDRGSTGGEGEDGEYRQSEDKCFHSDIPLFNP